MSSESYRNNTVYLYTDGACSSNPGPGGYGIVLKCAGVEKEMSAGFAMTTNNRMELMAVIEGLKAIKWDRANVVVTSDSKYVVDAINQGWLENWKRKGFKKVKNPDLWMELVPLLAKHNVSFVWVKGHNEHPENERCDKLAVAARTVEPGSDRVLPEDSGFSLENETLPL